MTSRFQILAIVFLPVAAGWLSGCGEAERPRFVPAAGNPQSTPPTSRPPGDGASREGAIPKNIPMH